MLSRCEVSSHKAQEKGRMNWFKGKPKWTAYKYRKIESIIT